MPPFSFTIPAACAIGVALAAAPATAGAATVTLDRSCYAEEQMITQTGSGFAPDSEVRESVLLVDPASSEPVDSLAAPPLRTDAAGAFTRAIHAPDLAVPWLRREQATSTFSDDSGAAPATVEWTLAGWGVDIARWLHGRAKPRKRMRVEAYGWTSASGSTLYAHYLRSGREVKRVAVGQLAGACGDLTARMRQFPFAPVKAGKWKVYFNTAETLDKVQDDWVRWTVRVRSGAAVATAARTVTRHTGAAG